MLDFLDQTESVCCKPVQMMDFFYIIYKHNLAHSSKQYREKNEEKKNNQAVFTKLTIKIPVNSICMISEEKKYINEHRRETFFFTLYARQVPFPFKQY